MTKGFHITTKSGKFYAGPTGWSLNPAKWISGSSNLTIKRIKKGKEKIK
jgi:hypothetical protein